MEPNVNVSSGKKKHFVMTKEQNAIFLAKVRDAVKAGKSREDCVKALNVAIPGLNIDGAGLSTKMTQLRASFAVAAEKAVIAFEQKRGRKLSKEELQEVAKKENKKLDELYPTFKRGRTALNVEDDAVADLLVGLDDDLNNDSDAGESSETTSETGGESSDSTQSS